MKYGGRVSHGAKIQAFINIASKRVCLGFTWRPIKSEKLLPDWESSQCITSNIGHALAEVCALRAHLAVFVFKTLFDLFLVRFAVFKCSYYLFYLL